MRRSPACAPGVYSFAACSWSTCSASSLRTGIGGGGGGCPGVPFTAFFTMCCFATWLFSTWLARSSAHAAAQGAVISAPHAFTNVTMKLGQHANKRTASEQAKNKTLSRNPS